MRGGEPVGGLQEHLQQRRDFALGVRVPASRPGTQRLALDVLHREVHLPRVLADLEDRNDVGMAQPRERDGLAPQCIARTGPRITEHLDGDHAIERWIPRGEHQAHATAANLPQYMVLGDPRRLDTREHLVAQPRQAHRGIEGVGAQLGGRRGLVCAEHGPPTRETPRGRLRITSSVRSIAAVAGRDPPTLRQCFNALGIRSRPRSDDGSPTEALEAVVITANREASHGREENTDRDLLVSIREMLLLDSFCHHDAHANEVGHRRRVGRLQCPSGSEQGCQAKMSRKGVQNG